MNWSWRACVTVALEATTSVNDGNSWTIGVYGLVAGIISIDERLYLHV
jgi:hypothetical protein